MTFGVGADRGGAGDGACFVPGGIAGCAIGESDGRILEDVVLASTAWGNGQKQLYKAAINLASAARLGATDFCDTGE